MGLDNVAVQWPRTGKFYEPVDPAEFADFISFAEKAPPHAGPAAALATVIARSATVHASAYTELVDLLSGGNLLAMLLFTAVICLILGMGLPTTANYIVVATLMAPVVVELAAQNDLAVALVAVHMFVFYFGLMADVTPPVGLASFAAAAISGASPIATGVQAFRYEIRTALLPFIFIFNHELLLIGMLATLVANLVVLPALIARRAGAPAGAAPPERGGAR